MGMTRHNHALITGFSHLFLWHVWGHSGYPPLEVLDGIAHTDGERARLGQEGDEGLDGVLQVSGEHLLWRSRVVLNDLVPGGEGRGGEGEGEGREGRRGGEGREWRGEEGGRKGGEELFFIIFIIIILKILIIITIIHNYDIDNNNHHKILCSTKGNN